LPAGTRQATSHLSERWGWVSKIWKIQMGIESHDVFDRLVDFCYNPLALSPTNCRHFL